MANPDDLGCAVRPDGTLKDASEIDWQFDKDNETPVVVHSPSVSQGVAVVQPASSSQGITSFFLKIPAPAVIVAGARRSSRTSRPSTCVLDPDNALNGHASPKQGSAGQKRKAVPAPASRRVSRKVVVSDDEDGVPGLSNLTDNEGDDTDIIESVAGNSDGATAEFDSLQSMADAVIRCVISCTSLRVFFYFFIGN